MTRSLLAASGAGAACFFAAPPPAGAVAGPATATAATATTVSVTMTEFKFALSRRTMPVGTVVFRLVNKGTVAHNFRIAGKRSALIAPGATGTLRVTFRRAGRYSFLCTVSGHAAAGQKGALTVSRSVSVTIGRPSEFRFRLSRTSVPRGPVTFGLVNRGRVAHTFRIAGKRSRLVAPGKRATLNVTFRRAGRYAYVCTVPGHAAAGQRGVLRVR
jgi:uncharacterized cupredoxin-like copper-binding protein